MTVQELQKAGYTLLGNGFSLGEEISRLLKGINWAHIFYKMEAGKFTEVWYTNGAEYYFNEGPRILNRPNPNRQATRVL